MRGIAASWVVLFHARDGGHIPDLLAWLPGWLEVIVFRMGHYGVPVFFALSGFVIAHSLRDATLSHGFLGRFLLRRSIRLDPPYWGAIAIVILFGWLSAQVKHEPFAPPSAGTIVAHILYLQNFLDVPTLNPVFWTLTQEVQFYIFYAGLLVIAAHLTRRGFGAAMPIAWGLMGVLALASAFELMRGLPGALFVHLWADFFVGVLAYWAVERRDARIGLVVLVVPLLWVGPWDVDSLFARASAVTALALFVATATGYSDRGLSGRWPQFLGAISYSLYLLHNSITGAAGMIGHRIAGRGIAADAVTLAFIIATSVFGAWLYWLVVERTAHRLSRKVSLKPGALIGQPVTA